MVALQNITEISINQIVSFLLNRLLQWLHCKILQIYRLI